jgi:hypothetical protein
VDRQLAEYYRIPDDPRFAFSYSNGDGRTGFFRFGNATCFGKLSGQAPAASLDQALPEVPIHSGSPSADSRFPFNPPDLIDSIRSEQYASLTNGARKDSLPKTIARKGYYAIREILPVGVRRHLQRVYLRGWQDLPFPKWPVDFTIDDLHEHFLREMMVANSISRMPFIWFWPEGASACVIMTHDVEAAAGKAFCSNLMDMDDAAHIKSSFQVIPEVRYPVEPAFLGSIRARGFEVNVHDLNHDGSLFREREEFLRRAAKINRYISEFQALGFRAGAMYRNQEWMADLNLSYDMSVPNVAHLEPQRGGCCTVMPYFIGNIVELPLTMTQDYSLFHIMENYSIDVWKNQIDLVSRRNGLLSFISHPDYLQEARAQKVYTDLLAYLDKLRAERNFWIPLPYQAAQWWRDRRSMKLVQSPSGWRIEGPGSDRARVAYATITDDRLTYSLDAASATA